MKDWGGGVKLSVHAQARHAACEFRGTKILSWALNLAMLEEAQEAGFDEVILLNERGEVSECTSANIFAAQGSQVWTPPLDSGCLPGVTRELLLEEVRVEGISTGERDAAAGGPERATRCSSLRPPAACCRCCPSSAARCARQGISAVDFRKHSAAVWTPTSRSIARTGRQAGVEN